MGNVFLNKVQNTETIQGKVLIKVTLKTLSFNTLKYIKHEQQSEEQYLQPT